MSVTELQTVMKKKPDKRMLFRRKRGLLRKKRKFTAAALAALIPGMGHIYLGLSLKGIAFIMLLLLDMSALLYFSSIGMQINVPLLILLGLLIPVAYFYNVYDVLQTVDYIVSRRRRGESEAGYGEVKRMNPFKTQKGISVGFLLILSGLLMFLFHQKPPWLQTGIREYGAGISAVLLIAFGAAAALGEIMRGSKRKPK